MEYVYQKYLLNIIEYYLINDVRISVDTNILYRDYKTNYQVNDDRVIAELKAAITKYR